MKLGELLERVQPVETGVDQSTEVTSLAYDSRRVEKGSVFFAIAGEQTDGHLFIEDAVRRGVVAIVSERVPPAGFGSKWVRVGKIRRALSEAARRFYDDPDVKLRVIGITGTNGKTTTAWHVVRASLPTRRSVSTAHRCAPSTRSPIARIAPACDRP